MLLAMAIAMLPLSAGFATAAPASARVTTSAAQATPDCSHHQHHDDVLEGQTQKSFDHGACIAGCPLCFVVVNAEGPGVAYSVPISMALKPMRGSIVLPTLMGSPPFRPPRA
jgi:hypothetical protein